MVTSSKILTVTYGTFSCTLEGFDDPFTTLQKVAEYFRKLAAEDRYFGGTPQTPDTETLRRIAEANSPKPINAEVGEHGITLRQSADIAEAPPVPFDVGQSETDAADHAEPVNADADEDDAAPVHFFRSRRADHDAEPEFEAAPEPEAVAAPEPKAAPEPEPAPEPAAESDDIGRVVAGIAAAAGSGAAIRAAAPAKDVEQTLAAIRQNVEQAEHEIEAIGQSRSDVDLEDDEAEPEILAEAEPEPEVMETVEAEAELPAEPVEAEADDLITAEAEAEIETEETEAETIADEFASFEAEPAVEEDAFAAEAEIEEYQPEAEVAETPAPVEAEAAELSEPEAEADEAPYHADLSAEAEPVPASTLSEEEEADLARQLAAAMEPDAGIAAAAPDETQWRAERRRRASALRQMAAPTNGNGALDRLLHTAQVQMDHPEQQRRVNALDQLKAAVAATEADAELRRKKPNLVAESESDDASEMESFRRDFRQVQSHAGFGRLSGGGEHRPASPLILVSEQRIDEPRTDDHPMREVAESHGNLALKPRVVSSQAEDDDDDEIQGIPSDAFSGATSFEDFVERVGVFEMTELLEAAAAYTSIVEGEDRFSRASVMSKIAMLNHGDGYSKEAGLRAFGKLLREGKILRVQDGQFAISKASRYSVASRYES
ncbi:MAG: hypothetical protein K8F59_00520 [Rhodobacteraceae bacterium]|nr:hypothetical protein [Paracoccaceae bacterium]